MLLSTPPTQTPPKGGTGADAWVVANGSAVISSSFNIASVSTPGAGKYDYTFITPMPSDNYAVVATADNYTGDAGRVVTVTAKSTTGFSVSTKTAGGDGFTNQQHSVVVHASNATLPETISKEQIDDLEARPTCSAWGISQSDASVIREFNIATCTKGGGPGIYIYTFKEPMPDIQYSVQVTPSNSSQVIFCTNTARSETGFTVRVYKTDGTGQDSGHMVLIHGYN